MRKLTRSRRQAYIGLRKVTRILIFLHAYVKGRRKRLQIHRIEDSQGRLLETEQEIGNKAIKNFQDQFQENYQNQDFGALNCILKVLTKIEEMA